MSFLEGLLTGSAMILFIGPVLFTLLQASLSYGYKGGLAVSIGIILSDILVIAICFMGAKAFFLDEGNRVWIAVLAAIILISMAIRYLLKPQYFEEGAIHLGALSTTGLIGRGFLVNFVNPFVFVVWIGIIGYGEERFAGGLWLYLIGTIIGIFLTDNLKAYFAGKLKRFLSEKRMKVIYQAIALLLIIFALRLFYVAYQIV